MVSEDFNTTYVSDTYGRGGQHTNGPDHGIVRVEHTPTRTAVEVHTREARSRYNARELAMTLCRMAVSDISR